MTTNLFVIDNVKQLRTDGSFRILLPLFQTSWGVGVLTSAIFNSLHNRVEFGTILEGFRNFGAGGGVEHPNPPSVRHCGPLHPHHGPTALLRGFTAAFRRTLRHYSCMHNKSRCTNQYTRHTYTKTMPQHYNDFNKRDKQNAFKLMNVMHSFQ